MDQEAVISKKKTIVVLASLLVPACTDPTTKSSAKDAGASAIPSAETVPRASFTAVPVTQFADAADVDGQPPFEQAKEYYSTGQLWKARLVLESKALSEGATKEETELLAEICNRQEDADCVAKCGAKLGRKLKFDAGAPRATASAGGVHSEPDSDLARARDLYLKNRLDEAHKILEPKVLDGRASKEEIRLLKTVCDKEGNRMCVALCEAKLK